MTLQVLKVHTFFIISVLISVSFRLLETAATSMVIKPECPEKCGNVSIPYPFGIGRGCYLDKDYEVICNNSQAFYNSTTYGTIRLLDISMVDFRLLYDFEPICYDKSGKNDFGGFLYEAPQSFSFSHRKNKLISIGCDIFSYITLSRGMNYTFGCASLCPDASLPSIDHSCSGTVCCQTTFPYDTKALTLNAHSINTGTHSWKEWPCSFVFVAEKDYPLDYLTKYKNLNREKSIVHYQLDVPLVVNWVIGNGTCNEARLMGNYACQENSSCIDQDEAIGGYRCQCISGYEGNPYLPDGCQDIDECKDPEKNHCSKGATCINHPGNYSCSCPHGYNNNCTVCIRNDHRLPLTTVIPLYTGAITGLLIILFCMSYLLYRRTEKEKEKNLKQQCFRRNGGLLLQQQMFSFCGRVDKTKLYSKEELEKATDNFNESRILGKGGLGTVYKAMLSDGSIVAVKMSNEVDEHQVGQFINEVFILSQINHRNIVKLLGCCLETHVPLLVYEYIPNGTLSHHLHDNGIQETKLSWETRFRIASEIAGALAYLHSCASNAIFHRDIKSSNILLDEKYRAVVSDFGISRSVPIDKSRLTTLVQGTFGYLDPEYFHSGQFTDKSDVYAFGVVLAELLTGEKAIQHGRCEEGLVMQFISAMKENRPFDILEDLVVKEGQMEEIMAMAKIAERCLKLNGKKRPTMRKVMADLDRLKRIQEEPLGHSSASLNEKLSLDDQD